MSYQIDQRKVAGVVVETNAAISNKGFNHGEVVLGLAELLGRTIVAAVGDQVQAQELLKVAVNHIGTTIRIGAEAQDKRIIIPGG
jgi:hypothetical protein